VNQEVWDDVDGYVEALLVHDQDKALEAALADSAAAGLPPIALTASQAKLLHLIARVQGARSVLELGTLGGYSTIWLARALPRDGRLITVEIDPGYADVARANVARAGLSDIVEQRVGPALDAMRTLAGEGAGPFDLIFIDADKSGTPEYFEWALELTGPGSLIVTDNVVRGGALVDAASEDPGAQGMRRFLELLGAAPGVTATAIQTVGAKGYDGFTVALVESQ
jgi:predicted O-methyltransferase YrrM